jgi:two-component system sensor histidine kinase KdpD
MRVVIGWVETKGRPDLEELTRNIPRVPPRTVRIANSTFTDFDFDAALAMAPHVLILDELAHSNLEGGRHAKRWQDALALREAGISVIGALNISHLETVAPTAERLIGFPVREIVPISFLRGADQVIALDISTEELESRLLSGRILRPEDIERAQNGIFRPQTLRMLREMMLHTIDDLTIPELSPAKTSTALALLTKGVDAAAFVRRITRIAHTLDLILDVASVDGPASPDLVTAAAESGARIISLPRFDATRPRIADVKATLIAVPNGPLAERMAAGPVDRDIFIANMSAPELALERTLSSGFYAQTGGDRMRIGYGRLTIYLGAAAGSGKTYAMLDRAHRLQEAGVDVVAAFIETHKRAETEKLLEGLEVLPREEIVADGMTYTEFDLAATLARKPAIALIDELAHSNAPLSLHNKRYDDVLTVLRSGISVITTLNIQHLEGLNDAVYRLTGTRVRETLPDEILRLADDVIFIDVTPEVLRERLRQGKVYPKERIETALTNFFRTENLASLRELAVREVIRARGEMPRPAPVGRVALGVKARERDVELIERCARLAQRLEIDLSVIHVAREREPDSRVLSTLEAATARVRARWQLVQSNDVAKALVRTAATEQAMTIAVEGRRGKSRWPNQTTFARRLLDADARQLLILAPALDPRSD